MVKFITNDYIVNMGYQHILQGLARLGYDIIDTNFLDTPNRCTRAFFEFVKSKEEIELETKQLFKKSFYSENDEMIVETKIPVVSLCPHHLLPVEMRVYIGYIPEKTVIGLSKLPRLAKLLGKQPILQEDYTKQIAETIFSYLKPQGVGIFIKGKHGCMRFRGVNISDTETITSYVMGNFKSNPSTRQEFLELCRNDK